MTDKLYKLRAWDPTNDSIFTVERTYESIVSNPFNLNAIDIASALLDRLRVDRGLDPLDPKTFDVADLSSRKLIPPHVTYKSHYPKHMRFRKK